MDEKKITPKQWEDATEKTIREAMERGEFDNLRGKGKPLDLDINPYTPADWQLAYKILKDAGAAPDWIEQGKEIRAELAKLNAWLADQIEWQRERLLKSKTLAPDKMIAERKFLAEAREQTQRKFRERSGDLNKAIDLYNLKAPSSVPHFTRIRIEEELEKLFRV
jgi:hypothetical protein